MKRAAQFVLYLGLIFLLAISLAKLTSTPPTPSVTNNQVEWIEVPPDETVPNAS